MDKYELVLDIIEHPDNYSEEQLREILADPEAKNIYSLLCDVDTAVAGSGDPDVDAEWSAFAEKHLTKRRPWYLWFGNRAASIAAVALTSILAVAAGIAVTVAVVDHSRPLAPAEATEQVAATAAVQQPADADADTIAAPTAPVLFENATLEAVMQAVGAAYGTDVRFDSRDAAALRLYYRLDPAMPLDEVVSQLNTFEQINISRDGNTLVIN